MSLEKRKRVGGFAYSLGCYPVQDFPQDEGYTVGAAPQEGEFGSRFEYEVLVSVDRLVDLIVRLTALLPDEVFFILESYPRRSETRRVYLTDSTYKRTEFARCMKRFERLWKDEGFVSFGAFSYDPAVEIFLNEHKSVMIYTPYAESTEEILSGFGLERFEVLEPYYMNVEHVHSSVADEDLDGETMLLREQVEAGLFAQYDFFDQTPVPGEDDIEPYDAEPVEEEYIDDDALPSWCCHVHGRLVVAPEGRHRDFHQIVCVAAPDEGLAAGWVREWLRETNARMVRIKELELVEASEVDPLVRPEGSYVQEGIWYESERVFLGDVS
ncbi:MAG: hypothetical protein JRG91_10085 [Deltaproteobacteria bacterium]|nr:hypothetical protein [Deltaproteobacteria bacterium]